jgi:conserved oligomeric Golgi complex subunit 2
MSTYPSQEGSRDPMDLDRLAEELAEREYGTTTRNSLETNHDLPVYVPLSHDNLHLSAKQFNVEEFLLSRAYTSLPDLRSELRDYLATLKEELVQLINDDYEAFISLSTDLRGEGTRLERLKLPLRELRSEILVSKPRPRSRRS